MKRMANHVRFKHYAQQSQSKRASGWRRTERGCSEYQGGVRGLETLLPIVDASVLQQIMQVLKISNFGWPKTQGRKSQQSCECDEYATRNAKVRTN